MSLYKIVYISVNFTLLFGLPRYRQLAKVSTVCLEDLLNRTNERIAAFASFIISWIDVLVDPLERLLWPNSKNPSYRELKCIEAIIESDAMTTTPLGALKTCMFMASLSCR